MVKHHDVIGRYVTIEVDDREYKVFYLQNGKGIPLVCQHTAGCHNHQWRGLLEDNEIIRFLEIGTSVYCVDVIGDSWAVDEKKDLKIVQDLILREKNK